MTSSSGALLVFLAVAVGGEVLGCGLYSIQKDVH
jgi:hypothetical protein